MRTLQGGLKWYLGRGFSWNRQAAMCGYYDWNGEAALLLKYLCHYSDAEIIDAVPTQKNNYRKDHDV